MSGSIFSTKCLKNSLIAMPECNVVFHIDFLVECEYSHAVLLVVDRHFSI